MPLMTAMSPRDAVLADLRGNGRYRYGRYNGLPLRYAGGKSLAVGYIIEHLPSEVESLVSPFFGGGSVEIACARELGIPVRGYDVFGILTNYWQVQLRAPIDLADRISRWEPDKETYAAVKKRLKDHWLDADPIADPVDLAAHYWFNHNLSYGPGFLGWMSGIYEDTARFRRLVDKVRAFRCPDLRAERGSFERTMPRHPAISCIGGLYT